MDFIADDDDDDVDALMMMIVRNFLRKFLEKILSFKCIPTPLVLFVYDC